jgi:hypothetical protein
LLIVMFHGLPFFTFRMDNELKRASGKPLKR